MSNLVEVAAQAVDNAISAISAIGDTKKVGAMVRKLTIVKADLEAEITKATIIGTLPTRTKKQKE